MLSCPETNEIVDLLDGRLDSDESRALQDHVDGCASCFALIAELARSATLDKAAASRSTDGRPLAPAHRPTPRWYEERRLEEYRLIQPIGRGAGGQVWLAEDTLLDRQVAIKFLAAAHETARERFRLEARAIARLSHPNVVAVFRVGEIEEQPYLVSELVRGKSLDKLERPVPWQRVREMGIALARGLAAAHRAGIVHRDIKPANAIVADSGEVKLLDFGLAKLDDVVEGEVELSIEALARAASTPALTATGHVLGTPLYMSPEAWRGARATAAMDVFSLGAVLYELCVGRAPNEGLTTGDVRSAALGPPPPSLVERVPGIDPAFAAVVARCLARDPAERYASGVELCAALEPAAAPAEVAPRAAPSRLRWLAASVLALAVVAIVLAVATGRIGANRSGGGADRSRAPVAAAPPPSPRARTPLEPQRCSADRWCWPASWVGSLVRVWGAAPDDVWAVGSRGVIRHYDGHTWTAVDVRTVADLSGVHGTGPDDVWVVGAFGTIKHRDKDGWRELPSGTRQDLFGVWARTRDDAWIVGDGGVTLHWDGKTWQNVPSATTQPMSQIGGSSADDVWASGFGAVEHWDGTRWTAFDVKSPELMLGLFVASARDAWIFGFHSTIRHWDGKRWSRVDVPVAIEPDPVRREDHPFNSASGTGGDDVWAIAKWGDMIHWDGKTWSVHPRGTRGEMFSISMITRDDGWAVGDGGAITHWDGHQWHTPVPDPVHQHPRAVWGTNADDVWVAGGDKAGFVRHWDGATWHDVAVPNAPGLDAVSGSSASSTNDSPVWFAGDDGAIEHWNGRSLQREETPTHRRLRGVWRGEWAVGDAGTILHRGAAWQAVDAGTTADLQAVWGAASDDVWIVGDGGTILHWDGERWTPRASGTAATLYAIWGASAADVWAVGDDGATLHWDGHAWRAVFSDFSENLDGVWGSGPDDVWASSGNTRNVPALLHWDGMVWTQVARTARTQLDDVWVASTGEAWAIGAQDTFLHFVP